MIRLNVVRKVCGDVLKASWQSSGMFPSPITSALIGPNRACVQSIAAVSSGGGSYYCNHQLPGTPQKFVNEWRAWINSYEYVSRQIISVETEVAD